MLERRCYMKVLVLGAGQVGQTVVQALTADENMEITVVDIDQDALKVTQDRYPCRTELGSASNLAALENAGIADSDVLIAVTKNDEVNLLACNLAYQLFNTPQRIARIRDVAFLKNDVRVSLFGKDAQLGVNHPVCPENIVVDQIQRLVQFEGALDAAGFVDNKILCILLEIEPGSSYAGVPITQWEAWEDFACQVVAVRRNGRFVRPLDSGTVNVEIGDAVLLLVFADKIEKASIEGRTRKRFRHIAIAGGGTIGTHLAAKLRDMRPTRYVKVIEADENRAAALAEELETDARLTVLHGDASDRDFLQRNDINDSDLFCAVTDNDLVNVVSTLTSKELNISTAFTLVKNLHFIDPLRKVGIEIPISPQESTAAVIRGIVREQTLSALHRVGRLGIDLVEITIQGDETSSNVIGVRTDEIKLPKGCHFIAVVREEEGDWKLRTHLQLRETKLKQDDRALFLIERTEAVSAVERQFRVKAFSVL